MVHGSPGALHFTSGDLSFDDLSRYTEKLNRWFSQSQSRLVLYGCRTGAEDAGKRFVERLSLLTRARVTASNHIVGHKQWPSGADTIFDQTVLNQYTATLGDLTFQEAYRDGGTGGTGLNGAWAVTVSPDGKHIYIASNVDDTVSVFERDLVTGKLTFKQTYKDGGTSEPRLEKTKGVTIRS